MKLAIIGSRNIDDIDISKYIIRPNYKLYGRGGAIIRNKEIVEIADEVLAFWDGKSKGTKSTIDFALKSKKPVTVVEIKS